MTKQTVLRLLAGRTSPERGLTAAELAAATHTLLPVVRNVLAQLVFTHRNRVSVYRVTCDARGRHYMGDPSPLYAQGAMPPVTG